MGACLEQQCMEPQASQSAIISDIRMSETSSEDRFEQQGGLAPVPMPSPGPASGSAPVNSGGVVEDVPGISSSAPMQDARFQAPGPDLAAHT